jgi:hypothetical protein
VPLYEAIAQRHGVVLEMDEVAAITSEGALLERLAPHLEARR